MLLRLLALLGWCHFVMAAEDDRGKLPPPISQPVEFARDIRPILARSCFRCHGPETQKNGLRLDIKAVALKGGLSGPDIIPGQSESSRLIRLVAGLEEDLIMPQKGDRLSPTEISLLRGWIDQGAIWPDDPGGSEAPAEPFWSLKPPVKSTLPAVKLARWGKTAVDRFILARLETEGLSPGPEADRRTLIRRVSYDLTGLPPTPADVEAFLSDRSATAYEKVVDRLLSSPRYGERWARHWLDVVRFAESHGFEMNNPRPNAWAYRDYVVRAFNEDKPYDRFVLEQLAGDGLNADEATGFLVGGPWDQVKSPDVQLTKQQRADELHDMTATTGSAFLGLTVGCARCHDHKFDPITQKDYYSMQSIFAGVQHGERPWPASMGQERRAELDSLRRSMAALERELESFEPLALHPAAPNDRGGLRAPVNARRNVERFAPISARYVRFTIEATDKNAEPCLDEVEVFATGENPYNVALAGAGAKATASGTLPNFVIHKIEHLNDGQFGNSHSWISDQRGKGWVQVELKQSFQISKIVWGRDREGVYADRLPTRYKIEVAEQLDKWKTVATSEDRQPFGPGKLTENAYSVAGMPPSAAQKLAGLLVQQTNLQARLAAFPAEPMVYAGKFEEPPPAYRLYRGDPMQPREPVAPGGIARISPRLELPPETPEAQRRLALARWMSDPRNPLTARVIVNRLWHYHFGQGIVNTPSDFGQMGGRPSHPELLDWLACELTANGWRLKEIQRLIVLSSAYRQSSALNAKAARIDAGDRLLWRFPPQRLEAEEVRDAILAASGKLDLRMGGPGFDVFEPNSNYVRIYAPKEEFGPAEWRRMIYQFKPRMQQDGVFGAFDCPDGAQIAPRRTSSITPLQALNLLNSRFLLQQSDFFARRIAEEAGAKAEDRVVGAFALAFSRKPSRQEISFSTQFIRREGLTAFCRALFNANEFIVVY